MTVTRRTALQMAIGGTAGAALWASTKPRAKTFRRSGIAFDTVMTLTIISDDAGQARSAFDAAFVEIRRLEAVVGLSTDGSQIQVLNRTGCLRKPDPSLIEILQTCTKVHSASDGAFDVTVQPLWLLYDGFAKQGLWPGRDEIARTARLVDQAAVRISEAEVSFTKPGMGVTLNSLTHGYAADRVAGVFARHGIARAFIDTGELEARGRPDASRPWTAGIRHPRNPQAFIAAAPVTRGCMATAGDYAYFWSPDFSRNHILDPRTAASPQSFASVSVIAACGLLADALSTAVCVVGPERAEPLLKHFDAKAFGVTKQGAIFRTPGFPLAVRAASSS